MQEVFLRAYDGLMLSIGQPLVFDFHGQNLKATVHGVHNLDVGGGGGMAAQRTGILTQESEVNWLKNPESAIKLKSSAKKSRPNAILAPNFKFEDMGIGGLDSEFSAIFRRAFASRIFPPGLVDKLGITHVKGAPPCFLRAQASELTRLAIQVSYYTDLPAPARRLSLPPSLTVLIGADILRQSHGATDRQDAQREGAQDCQRPRDPQQVRRPV